VGCDPGPGWTVDEYCLRCELGLDQCEVWTEGDGDRAVIEDFLEREELSATVLHRAMLEATDEEVVRAGFLRGAKGALLMLAAEISVRARASSADVPVLCVVDRDYDGVPAELERYVLATDGHSMESYCLDPVAVRRIVRVVLVRDAEPLAEARPVLRGGVDGGEVLARVQEGCLHVAAVRMALRELTPPVALCGNWARCVLFEPNGVRVDTEELMRRSCGRNPGVSELERVAEWLRIARSNPFGCVRGRDIVTLLLRKLTLPAVRNAIRFNFGPVDEKFVRGMLLVALPLETLRRQPMFEALAAWVRGWDEALTRPYGAPGTCRRPAHA